MDWDVQALREVVLESEVARLRRITINDKTEYARIAYDPDIWSYFTSTIEDERGLDGFIERAIHDGIAGTRVAFSIIDKASGSIAGSTAFGNLAASERRLEIGWSWLGREFRGTAVNRAAKGLLLEHAFVVLGCERVEFKTDVLNLRARRGLEGIGATEEGVLRSFNVMPGGRRRDAVYYSILKAEWPGVRAARFGWL